MKLSAILTINNRPPEVSRAVADSFRLPGNQPNEMVVVLDRPEDNVRQGAVDAYSGMDFPVTFVSIDGEPGWLGPAKAWNEGFNASTGDLFYCISSEVVQDEGNIAKARKLAEGGNSVVFGSCWNSVETPLLINAPPGLLCSSKFPRPLGFIVCMPADKVMAINGFDEDFMRGYWYDDADFFFRLFGTGVEFVFDDSINGVHLDHDRPELNCPQGWKKIAINKELMIEKHGKEDVWNGVARMETTDNGRCAWAHP